MPRMLPLSLCSSGAEASDGRRRSHSNHVPEPRVSTRSRRALDGARQTRALSWLWIQHPHPRGPRRTDRRADPAAAEACGLIAFARRRTALADPATTRAQPSSIPIQNSRAPPMLRRERSGQAHFVDRRDRGQAHFQRPRDRGQAHFPENARSRTGTFPTDRAIEDRHISLTGAIEDRHISRDRAIEDRHISSDRAIEDRDISRDRAIEDRHICASQTASPRDTRVAKSRVTTPSCACPALRPSRGQNAVARQNPMTKVNAEDYELRVATEDTAHTKRNSARATCCRRVNRQRF